MAASILALRALRVTLLAIVWFPLVGVGPALAAPDPQPPRVGKPPLRVFRTRKASPAAAPTAPQVNGAQAPAPSQAPAPAVPQVNSAGAPAPSPAPAPAVPQATGTEALAPGPAATPAMPQTTGAQAPAPSPEAAPIVLQATGDRVHGDGSGTTAINEADETFDNPELPIKTEQQLPRFGIGPVASTGLNTQVVAGGVMGWLYFEKTFHLFYRYQLGALMTGRDLRATHYGALLAGVPVYEARGVTTTTLIHGVQDGPDNTEYLRDDAEVPTHTTVVVEAGALVSPLAYNQCDEACQSDYFADPAAGIAHVGTLAAGARYRYFYHADAPELFTSARQSLDLSVHVLALSLGLPKGKIYGLPSKELISPLPVGLQASVAGVPAPWFPIFTEVGAGLLPATGTWFLSAGVGYYFY